MSQKRQNKEKSKEGTSTNQSYQLEEKPQAQRYQP
jgi:hypothetical protein